MSDSLVRGVVKERGLVVVAATATLAAREARERQSLAGSSSLLAEALVAGALVAALQESEPARINLQIEGNGPARGLLVDADPHARVRGYVKTRDVALPESRRHSLGAVLGQHGYVSVLRDRAGDIHRSHVELVDGNLARTLERFFRDSVGERTLLALEVTAHGDEELGYVGGVLVQQPKDVADEAMKGMEERLRALALDKPAIELLDALTGEESVLIDRELPLSFACTCSRERVLQALQVLPNVDLFEMIHKDKQADVDCEFCGRQYVVTKEELQQVLDVVDERDTAREVRAKGRPN